MKKRLAALTLCFAMAASMLAGCGEKEEDDNKELVLYTWEGLFPQEVLDGFEEETGIKIISSNFDTNETMLEKIQQTDGKDYDIVVGDDYIIEQIVKNGLAKKLRTEAKVFLKKPEFPPSAGSPFAFVAAAGLSKTRVSPSAALLCSFLKLSISKYLSHIFPFKLYHSVHRLANRTSNICSFAANIRNYPRLLPHCG